MTALPAPHGGPPDERVLRLSRRLAWAPNPVTGPFRRAAAAGLAALRDLPDAVAFLLQAITDSDPRVAERARAALRDLPPGGPSAARICQLWAASRDPFLASLVAECHYQAATPPALRVLSALKSSQWRDIIADPALVPSLITALSDADPDVAATAQTTLSALESAAAIDVLCHCWAASRDSALAAILVRRRFLALQPPRTRVLSGLLCGRLDDLLDDPAAVPELIGALHDSDPALAANAQAALRRLRHPAAVDALLDAFLELPRSPELLALVHEQRYRHSDEGRWFLFLALAGRFDEYLDEDFEFQRLRLEFRGAPEPLQQRIRETILTRGDLRMNPLFVVEQREKLLAQLSAADADTLVRINVRNHNWESLFSYLWVLPARQILAATVAMQHSGWLPEDTDRAALLEKLALLATAFGPVPGLGTAPAALSSAMRVWLAEGARGDLGQKTDLDLRALLTETTPPPAQIAVLGALRHTGRLSPAFLRLASKSPHPMVQFAAVALGSPARPEPGQAPWWFKRLAPVLESDAFWTLKPCELSREDLRQLQERLNEMPDRRLAGGLNFAAAVAAHYTAHDIEVEATARVHITADAFEIEG